MSEHTAASDTHSEYIGSLCQTCGQGAYVLTEQGVECDECTGVAGLSGTLPPVPPRVNPPEGYEYRQGGVGPFKIEDENE